MCEEHILCNQHIDILTRKMSQCVNGCKLYKIFKIPFESVYAQGYHDDQKENRENACVDCVNNNMLRNQIYNFSVGLLKKRIRNELTPDKLWLTIKVVDGQFIAGGQKLPLRFLPFITTQHIHNDADGEYKININVAFKSSLPKLCTEWELFWQSSSPAVVREWEKLHPVHAVEEQEWLPEIPDIPDIPDIVELPETSEADISNFYDQQPIYYEQPENHKNPDYFEEEVWEDDSSLLLP